MVSLEVPTDYAGRFIVFGANYDIYGNPHVPVSGNKVSDPIHIQYQQMLEQQGQDFEAFKGKK